MRRGPTSTIPWPPSKRFGEEVTLDHMFAYTDKNESITADLNALVIYDRGTRWLDAFQIKSLAGMDIYNRMHFFEGPARHSVVQHA